MVAYALVYTMQSALPLPSGPRVPPAPLRSGVSQLGEPVSLKPSIVQQQSAERNSNVPAESKPSTSSAPATRSPLHAVATQQPLRPVRPAWDAAPMSPTLQMLSEPQMTLHEVLRRSAKLDGAQKISSQVLLATVSQTLKSNSQPSPFSSHLAAALTRAAATAAAVEQGQQVEQPPAAPSAWQQQHCEQQHKQEQAVLAMPGQQQQQQPQQSVLQQERHFQQAHTQCIGSNISDQQRQQQQQRSLALEQPVAERQVAASVSSEHSGPEPEQQQRLWPSQVQHPKWQQPRTDVQQLSEQQGTRAQAASHIHAAGLTQQDQQVDIQFFQQPHKVLEEVATHFGSSAQGPYYR